MYDDLSKNCGWVLSIFALQSGRTSSGKSSRSRSRKASAKSVRSQVSDSETQQDKEGEAKEGDQDGNKVILLQVNNIWNIMKTIIIWPSRERFKDIIIKRDLTAFIQP